MTLNHNLETVDNPFGQEIDPSELATILQGQIASGLSIAMSFGGQLDALSLPATDLGSDLAPEVITLTIFSARRGVPGSAGTTTVQLEVNGAPVAGATLSWVPADAAFALKTVVVSQAVAKDDRVSFRVTAAETGGEDIFARAA